MRLFDVIGIATLMLFGSMLVSSAHYELVIKHNGSGYIIILFVAGIMFFCAAAGMTKR